LQRGSFIIDTGTIVLGRYEIVSRLGEGGMGIVYKAYDQSANRFVAIKLISQDRLKNQKSVLRFKQEAIATARLNHPTITKVFDCGLTDDEQPYLVMEFAEGKTLSSLITEEGQLPLGETLTVFIQICDGLAHAHENKVLHRDLKPSNIMLNRNADSTAVKILDFGIAKILESAGVPSLHLTHTGELLGSPLYMSPEQAKGGDIDQRSDLYSLGCSIYEALTGGPPHIGESPISTLLKRESLKPLSMGEASLGLEFPQELEDIVAKLLKHDPNERYQSAAELKRDLLKVDAQPVAKPKIDRPVVDAKVESAPTTRTKRQNFQPILLGTTAVLILAVASVAFVLFGVSERHPDIRPATESFAAPSQAYQNQISQLVDHVDLLTKSGDARIFTNAGRYDEAAASYLETIKGCMADPIKHAAKITELRQELAWTYMLAKKYALASQQYELAAPDIEKTLAPDDPNRFAFYTSLAESYRHRPERTLLAKAVELDEKAVKYYQAHRPKYDKELDLCWQNQDDTLARLGKCEQNIRLLNKLLEFRNAEYGSKSPQSVFVLCRLAESYRGLGKFDKAITYDKRWVDIYDYSSNKVEPKSVDALAALAYDYFRLTNEKDLSTYKPAVQWYERLVKICEKEPDHYLRQLAQAYEYLGVMYQHMGRADPSKWKRAEIYQEQALKIYRSLPNFDKRTIALVWIRWGYTQLAENHPDQGLSNLEEALKFAKKALGTNALEVMQVTWTLAEGYRETNRYKLAQPYYEQVSPLIIQHYGRASKNYADVLDAWATNERYLGRLAKARSLIEDCLAIRRKILGPKKPLTQAAEAELRKIDDAEKK
jgi:serine/threonine protein kinase/tetratricopeptide (TPR) repeat protein